MSKSIYDKALDNTQTLLALVNLQELNSKKKLDMLNQIEQALEKAQKQEQEHIEYSKKVQEQFSNDTKRIGELESKLIRQEKLLNLYREKEKHEQEFPALNNIEYEDYQRIKTKIKELENNGK